MRKSIAWVVVVLLVVIGLYGCGGGGGGSSSGGAVDDGKFHIPQATITVDGSAADWSNVASYITDTVGDNTASDADIWKIYLARDTTYLYVLLRLSTGNNANPSYEYHLRYDFGNDRNISLAYTAGSWTLTRRFQGSAVETFPSNYVSVNQQLIEYKVPLTSIQTELANGAVSNGMADLFAVWQQGQGPNDYDDAAGIAVSFN